MAQGAQRPARQQQQRNLSKSSSPGSGTSNAYGTNSKVQSSTCDETTITYIKRVLCSDLRRKDSTAADDEPLEELLPPLTSSNAVDIQLYALIAAILSNFVQVWYNQITPDQNFVSEIVQIIAHCTRALEQRIRQVDLETLLLDELPGLLIDHVAAVRTCQASRVGTATMQETRVRYNALRPHRALEPVPRDLDTSLKQQENEDAWCILLVDRVLPLLLPPEDLQNPCLHVLVTEVFAGLIFRGGICNKASESWLLWDGFTKLIHASRSQADLNNTHKLGEKAVDRLEEHGLLSENRDSRNRLRKGWHRTRIDTMFRLFWIVVQGAMTVWLFLRALTVALLSANSIPPRSDKFSHRAKMQPDCEAHSKRTDTPACGVARRPIVSMQIWECVAQLVAIDRRMPWLSGTVSLLRWISLHGPGQVCHTNSRLDRLMSSKFHNSLLDATWLPSVLQAARSSVFPGNALAPARTPPTQDEVLQIKRGCAEAIVEAIPEVVRTRFFASQDADVMADDVEAELGLLEDSYVNKHLIVSAVELIAVRLFPELGHIDDQGVN